LTGVSDKITSKEPEHVSCDICMKEVPIDEANSFEAVGYVVHFCGLECFEKWKKKKQSAQIGDDFEIFYPGPLRFHNR
jgi:hypothetical protein